MKDKKIDKYIKEQSHFTIFKGIVNFLKENKIFDLLE